ncbi:sugar-transfer associated ATP-grasp domain-containing protein [Natranaerobius thermophilus]|uniref:Alpha-L-glutamate ligase-related protein ATP-grasp domain-containing protein n=1 Tax=Natranaerobius thermophilus (strain ATCC BAA-1301 / DSM 18059 / JW/NM-WN-LF) TaxID=457570 RepID=B2A1P8_NATTJ|nr:sugar-transfer associated ATP-grasp domain-containing protein [Natranaerobius thermophilus]ACB86095.1 hypothetical protein Nther_2535 [Natranaerobius thermophilus JW/NM-WN-LF]
MEKLIKDVYERLRFIGYNRKHKKRALKALKCIEKDTGFKLSKKQKSQIREYAREVLGSNMYAPWLYVYTAYRENFLEGWIPDNYFGYIVAPKINKQIGRIANIKTLSKKIIDTNLIPDKFYFIDNTWYDENFNLIDVKYVKEQILKYAKEYYLKKDGTSQGKGVTRIDKDNFNLLDISNLGDCVIQESVRQADWFDKIITGKVATIRITTVKGTDHRMKARASFLRVERQNSRLVKSENAVKIPIVDDKGTLGSHGLDSNWKRHSEHPDSKFEFNNKKIPNFSKAVKACEELHAKIPHFTIIGWDTIITNYGEVKVLEWNAGHPGIKFSEALTGPCFCDMGWEELWKT